MALPAHLLAKGRHRALVLLLFVAILGASLWGTWQWHRSRARQAASDDPWANFTSPYRNARPGVKYVGDKTCTHCHTLDAQQGFHAHPMGRSFAPLSAAESIERFEMAA